MYFDEIQINPNASQRAADLRYGSKVHINASYTIIFQLIDYGHQRFLFACPEIEKHQYANVMSDCLP